MIFTEVNKMDNGVIASIVLYQPDIQRLQENILAIQNQVEKVVLVINGPGCENIVLEYDSQSRFVIIQNSENKGIAYALNQAMQYAYEQNYKWVLTLDQDTITPPKLVETLLKHQYCDKIGAIAPDFVDPNYYRESGEKQGVQFVLYCITSACLTNVNVWKEIGGFDDDLFIDLVDYDYCANMIHNGYAIVQDYDVKIKHEIGNGRKVYFGKHSIFVLNHAAFRKYYMARNALYYSKKWPRLSKAAINKREYFAILFIGILFVEKDKLRKLIAVFKGIFDSNKLIKKLKVERKIQLEERRKLTKAKEEELKCAKK